VHNFSDRRQKIALEPKVRSGEVLVDLIDEKHSRAENGIHEVALDGYGYRWFRVGAIDTVLDRKLF
jgi:maltose alpha-D-glucosyltransferase/alpha-amylase